MSKYEALGVFLKAQKHEFIPMTFSEIEQVLDAKLPESKKYPAWWSNNPSNNVMTKQWLDAGYETESVDTQRGKLVFRRKKHASLAKQKNGERAPIFGCMKGMLTIAPGYDLSTPTGDDWISGQIGGFGEITSGKT
jgi:hypothetical protein